MGTMKGIETRITFGRDIPGGGEVSTAEIEKFLTDIVDKLYDGYQIGYSSGVWKGEREKTWYILHVSPFQSIERKIALDIANQYKLRFKQESVLVRFYEVDYGFI